MATLVVGFAAIGFSSYFAIGAASTRRSSVVELGAAEPPKPDPQRLHPLPVKAAQTAVASGRQERGGLSTSRGPDRAQARRVERPVLVHPVLPTAPATPAAKANDRKTEPVAGPMPDERNPQVAETAPQAVPAVRPVEEMQPMEVAGPPAPAALPELPEPPEAKPEAPIVGKQDPIAIARMLDREIDQRLAAAKVPASALADDPEFVRRVYLDLVGHIPHFDKTVAFLNSRDPDKRLKLIDELLASPEYGEHFARQWRDLIINREDYDTYTRGSAPLMQWLTKEFNSSRGWDKTVTNMLTAEGGFQNPATVFTLANREVRQPSPARLVASTGQLFLGIQLRCAQCHNHPTVRKWKQTDFWAMAAFFGHIRDEGPLDGGGVLPSKNAVMEGEGNPPGSPDQVNPYPRALPGAAISIPNLDNPWKVTSRVVKAKFFEGHQPRLGTQGPYRPTLAAWVTSADNKYFARAAVNRLWAHFFARGIVNPIADMHDDNEPSHPEALKTLAGQLVASGFDHKHVIRCICNTRAYQRTSRPLPGNKEDEELFSHMNLKMLTPDQVFSSLWMASSGYVYKNEENSREEFARYYRTKEVGADPTEYTNGVPQVLHMMHRRLGGNVQIGARPLPGMGQVELAYLVILSRRPAAAEAQKWSAALKTPSGYDDMLWVLYNSAEFMFNH